MIKPNLTQGLRARITLGALLGIGLTCLAATQALAQTAPPTTAQASPQSMAAVPTTRVLAIGRLTKPLTPADLETVMPKEVRDTVALYLNGKIADWYIAKDAPGVVFILDVRSTEDARALTTDLPLVKAGLMQFQFIPLGPLSPLRLLMK